MSKLLLIDGHSILNRAFYGIPDLTNSEGIHTNAMYGFLNIMFRFIDEEKPDYVTVAFDLSAPTFRHKTYAEYKGTRKPMLPELKQQVPLMKELLKAMNIRIVEKEGFEADDLLGTIAKNSQKEGIDVSIVSGDRDLLQLADDKIKIRIPKTKKGSTEVEDYYPEDVKTLYGVTPQEFIEMKALMGDTSDNIPGAPGIGPKTASALIVQYHDINNIFEHMDELKPPKAKKSISENVEQIKLSRFLSEIKIDVDVDYNVNEALIDNMFNEESYKLFKRYDFKNMLKRCDGNMQSEPECYEHFKSVTELSEVENVFESARKCVADNKKVGISIMAEKEIYAVSLTFDDEDIYYIPVYGFVLADYLIEKMTELINTSKNRSIVIDNLKDYLPIFDKTGVDEHSFMDIAVAAYLIHPNNDRYDYEALSKEYMSMLVMSRQELLGKQSIKEAYDKDDDSLLKLACLTSYVNYKCSDIITDILKKEEMYELYETIEMPLIFVLYDMQKFGIRVDKEALSDYSKVLVEKINVLEKEIYEEAGEEFNINSPKQLGVILFEKLGMPNGKKTKSGYSTAADILDKLAPDYPIVKKILEYRQLTKLNSTYAVGLVPYISGDGRIHGTFNQTITATGRISSTDPNLQNIPIRMEMGKAIRKVFIPKDGCVFIDADYSQIELRILAHMSGDEKLIEAYNSSADIHRATAAEVFNTPIDEVTPLQRSNAKAVNFGIVYGISAFGLSQDLKISRKQAQEYIDRYFAMYPRVKEFLDGEVEKGKTDGYVKTMFNRIRPIPELKSSNFMQRNFGERVAMNSPIQGTAADIIKIAMVRVNMKLKEKQMKSRLLLQIHDELLIETHVDEFDEVKEILKNEMMNAVSLRVPLNIDIEQGASWYEAK